MSGHLEKSKESGYIHMLCCTGRIKADREGISARLANFLCTGRIMIGTRPDVVCLVQDLTWLGHLQLPVGLPRC